MCFFESPAYAHTLKTGGKTGGKNGGNSMNTPHLHFIKSHRTYNQGFSLIESMIILGIIALIIGGIWVAATAITSKLRINQAINEVFGIVQGTRNFFQITDYPSSLAYIHVTDVLKNAGVLPSSFILHDAAAQLYQDSQTGLSLNVNLEYSNNYPYPFISLNIMVNGYLDGMLNSAECTQIVRRIGALTYQRNQLVSLAFLAPSNYYLLSLNNLSAPIDTSQITCPSGQFYIQFGFSP